MTRTRWKIAALGLIIGFVASLIFHAGRALFTPKTPAFPDGVVHIAVDPSNPPFAFFDADGQVQGIEVDLGQAIADQLGLPVAFVPLGTDALYDALYTGNVDLVIASLQPEPFRTAQAAYSQPYFDAGWMLVSAEGYDSLRDAAGARISYEFGSEADQEIAEWSRRVGDFRTMPYETQEYALDALRLGLADAALVDAVTAELYLRQHPDWTPARAYITHRPYVIAVRNDRTSTLREIVDTLDVLFADDLMETLLDRWMR